MGVVCGMAMESVVRPLGTFIVIGIGEKWRQAEVTGKNCGCLKALISQSWPSGTF